jgi:DNA helicase TIP49 (TBP-interacting protein)
MITLLPFFFMLLQGTEVPYKPYDEFEVQIDYQFKQRNAINTNTVDLVETVAEADKKRYGTGIRPYLILHLKLIKLSDQEVKAQVGNNFDRTIFNKKVKVGDLVKIDMGFTDDVKDRVGPHEVKVIFFSKERKETSRINMFVQEDGTFLINGQVRGKF